MKLLTACLRAFDLHQSIDRVSDSINLALSPLQALFQRMLQLIQAAHLCNQLSVLAFQVVVMIDQLINPL